MSASQPAPDPQRAEYWSRFITGLPSVSGSADEAAFADRLLRAFTQAPTFRSERFSAWKMAAVSDRGEPQESELVSGDAGGPWCVAALARGSGRATVLLTGHYDTVPVDDYGDLMALALRPDELKQGLLKRLRAAAETAAEKRALSDLEGERYLPGRGLLDMKAGLAAALAVMEAFLASRQAAGNLLFVAVPDEEVNSVGARAAAPALEQLARERNLDIVAAINLDATADDHDGSTGRSVALGTIGKLLPSALVVGLPTHAGYSFNGLGACALAGAIAAEVEWSPELTDRTGNESGAGPTLLGMKDTKTVYNVTTPARVWMYWNVSTHRRSPANVIDGLKRIIERVLASLVHRWGEYRRAAGAAGQLPRVEIMTFDELRRSVFSAHAGAPSLLERCAREAARSGASLPEQCRAITERLWELSGRTTPAIVLGFASIPYLPTSLGEDRGGVVLERATRAAAEIIARRHGAEVATPRYFLGISDMSFFGQADEQGMSVIAANTPAWGFGLRWAKGRAFAGVPIVNAGPWGRDYHTVLERLHVTYAFEVLPDLVAEISSGVLREYQA